MTRTPASLLFKLQSDPDEDSWSRFVDLYAPLLYRWMRYHFGLPDHKAEDLCQEVFIVILQKMPEFRYDPGKSFRSWLFQIVRNKVLGELRKERIRESVLDPDSLQHKAELLTDPGSDIGCLLNEEYQSELLRRVTILVKNEVEPNTWEAFRRVVLLGQKPADVAQELGMTARAVRLAKFRILRRIRANTDGLLD